MNGYFITGIAAGLIGISIGAGGAYEFTADHYAAKLATEQASHAGDNEQHAVDLNLISKAALDAENRAIDAHTAAEAKIAAADAQFTIEKQAHETENSSLRRDLASGAQRLRVAVTNCTAAGGNSGAGTSSTTGMGDGATAYADLDRAVAERVFRIAGDDDNEISKVKALQAYVCAVRPSTPGCN
jgi:hypothetical protein